MRGFRLLAIAAVLGAATAALAKPPAATRSSTPSSAKSSSDAKSRTPAASSQPTHLYSRGFHTRIYAERKKSKHWIGYVRVGTSVKLRDPTPVKGPGCHQGFVAIEPYGFVCLDSQSTLSSSGRYRRSMSLLAPKPAPLPFHYALSNGTPMYRRLPSPEEWQKAERFYGKPGTHKPLSWGNRGHELLAEERAIAATDPIPSFLKNGGSAGRAKTLGLVRREIPLGSMLAYTHAIDHEGRTFLVSSDGTVVPADRVRPFRESTFEGVRLPQDASLPIAWIRKQPRPKYRRNPDGSFTATAMRWWVRSWIELEPSAAPVTHAGKTYLPTRDRDGEHVLYIDEKDATIAEPRTKYPWGVTDDDKWLTISITKGLLIAYEGKTPVFTTLVSPGAGGVPIKGRDPVKMSTTPTGVYKMTFKHVAATMSPEQGENRSFWIADVPYTQYFNAPFALHVAYWHENFGQGMSAGCVNVSPRDGQHLFAWTGPEVPQGWAGAAPSKLTGKATFVVVTR